VVDGDRVAFTLGPSEGGAGGPEPAALVYRAGASSSWFEEGTFAADDPAGSSYTALALAGDWLALASAAAADGRGVVDLYAFDGATWSLRQQLTGAQTQTFTGEALALDSNLLAATAIRDGQPVVELYRNDGEWRHEQTVALAAASLDLKGPRLAVGVASPQALHVYGRGGDLPTGVCVDDSDCSGSCVDGVCAPPDTTDEGDPEDADGCGCRSDAAPSPIASLLLLALVIAGSRRRPA
ncbi:MAG: hypothetical protein KC486_19085, partial [Myxococcales bacterium]|nr:hypothetical protein [Myxococcales bacterium]